MSYCSEYTYVVNPTTKQLRAIPPFSPGWRYWAATLAFDPTKSPHYKLVALYHEIDSEKNYYEIAIYNSKSSGWRIVSDFQMLLSFKDTNGVFWNGAINWFSRIGQVLVYFKVDEESPHTMPMPPISPGMRCATVRYFGEHRGHLYLALLFWKTDDRDEWGMRMRFIIYEMERDYSSWFIKYSIHFNEFVAAFPNLKHCRYDNSLLGLVAGMKNTADNYDDDGEGLFLVLHEPPHNILYYNLKNKKIVKISPHKRQKRMVSVTGRSDYYPYIESLSHV